MEDLVNRSSVLRERVKGSTKKPINAATTWLKRQPPKAKVSLAVGAAVSTIIFLRLVVEDHDNLFIASEAVHAIGISLLIYKLTQEKTCAGLSLKSQELTAMFLAARLYCSLVMEYDIHTLLDLATLATTLWVIYVIRFRLNSSYMDDKDTFALYYVVSLGLGFCFLAFFYWCCPFFLIRGGVVGGRVNKIWAIKIVIPCGLLSLVIHPSTQHHVINRFFWAFCVYLEAVSVLPQLHLMQNTKIVEPFTAHYVFALGVARFLSCAHWVLQVLDTRGRLLTALGYGLWPSMVLVSEIVQTFILADFCYYYVKSLVGGHHVLRLPSGVV